MTGYEDIRVERSDGVAIVTVERPARLNAYRDRTADEIADALARAEADAAVRALVLTGAGRAFGAGYDLAAIDPGAVPPLDRVLERHFNPLVRAMRASRLPIIVAVNGPCAGAAVGIALSGDVVIAARSAYFLEPFAGLALVPDAGNTLFLPRLVGRIRALPAMLLAERIDAATAAAGGLVWRVVDDAECMTQAWSVARRIAALPAEAVAATKRLVAAASDCGLDVQLDLERDLQGAAGASPATAAAIAAFHARRGTGGD